MKKQIILNATGLALFVLMFLHIDFLGSISAIFFIFVWIFTLALGSLSVLVQDKDRSYDFILETLLGAVFFSFLSVALIKIFLYSPGYTHVSLFQYLNPFHSDSTPVIIMLILEYLAGALIGVLIRGTRLVFSKE